jgi:hypothetical protein
MGDVFVHTIMSLDGFIAGPNDDMGWVFRHAGDMPGGLVDEVIGRTGAVLGGRRVYEVGRRVQQPGKRGLFDGRWGGPHFILTHTPPTDETEPFYTFLSGDVWPRAAGARCQPCRSVPRGGGCRRDAHPPRAGAPRGRGPAVRCPHGPRLPQDAGRVGIPSSDEPAISSRQVIASSSNGAGR